MLKKNKAFTLVEILIVLAIIGVLTSIAIASGSAAKRVARDNQRKTDIKLLQLKIETYRDQNGAYPVNLQSSLVSSFIPALPKDPSTKADYIFVPLRFSTGTVNCPSGAASYYLGAKLENGSSFSFDPAPLVPCDGTSFSLSGTNYGVTSPNAFK